MATMEKSVRQLNAIERRLLCSALTRRKDRERGLALRIIFNGLVLFAIFSGLMIAATILGKKGPAWYYALLFAALIAVPISLWSYLSIRPEFTAAARLLESALRRNEAQVTRIQSDAMVEFEEEDDEGACYAFQLDNRRIVFISGQEYYPSARFPNTDFSLVDIYGDGGVLATSLIAKNGKRLKATRTVPARQKLGMKMPDSLQTVEGSLDQIEQILSRE
jgi:hypothetical protein